MSDEAPPVIAVDWSGALHGERQKLWLAEVRDGRLVRVEGGRTRAELISHLLELAAEEPPVVGFDFAFSFPAWFVDRLGAIDARATWALVAERGERWLGACEPPFWGRPGKARPDAHPDRPALRHTERTHPAIGGVAPKPVFQVGGAGAVGTGSLRGMPYLSELRRAGFAVLPFDRAHAPLAVEIYPRHFTGRVNKSSAVARSLYLGQHFPEQPARLTRLAASGEDAFDAAVSALCMAEHVPELLRWDATRCPVERKEGRIWCPAREPFRPDSWPLLSAERPSALLRPELPG